jgi:molybdopterin/thiamine biosynthesis adenylyltransferase
MSPTLAERPAGFREILIDPGEFQPELPPPGARMPDFLSLPEEKDPTSILSRLRVACLGVGAVGRVAAIHLARLGVAVLWICDRSLYKPESVLTQPIGADEIGRPKARSVGQLAKRISPSTRVYAYDGAFETLGTTAFADADVVIMGTDNIRAELNCGQHCLHWSKPLIQASVHGATLHASVRFWEHGSAESPCPACGLTSQEWGALANDVIFSCDGSPAREVTSPTTSTPHLCSIAGGLAVNQVLRYALGLGADVTDREITWNGFTLETHESPLERRADCPADHTPWKSRLTEGPVGECTLRELSRAAGMHDDGRIERAFFRLGETSFVQRGVCRAGHGQSVESFIESGSPAGKCATCGEALRSEPFFEHDTVPSRLLVTQLDRPIRELTTESVESVLVRENGNAVVFRQGNGGSR